MKITVGQFAPSADLTANRGAIVSLADHAVDAQADLLLLPEESMIAATEVADSLSELAGREWGPFAEFIADTARDRGLPIVAVGYEPSPSGLPYNTTIAVDADGHELAHYRKMHLYDAFSYRESAYVMRGDVTPTVFDLHGSVLGLMNCYDVRFPELARALVELGADTLLVPAAWVDGPLKVDHWITMLRARAIENTCWVVGAGSSSPDCIGTSAVVDPLGRVVARLQNQSLGSLDVDLDKSILDEARFTLPVLRNRRILIGKG